VFSCLQLDRSNPAAPRGDIPSVNVESNLVSSEQSSSKANSGNACNTKTPSLDSAICIILLHVSHATSCSGYISFSHISHRLSVFSSFRISWAGSSQTWLCALSVKVSKSVLSN
jgi:hypothetical protein